MGEQVVKTAFVEPTEQSPPVPLSDILRDTGIPAVSNRQFEKSLTSLDNRRRKLLGLIEADERRWQQSNPQ